jgi:anti-sigma factor RsiW
VVHLLGDHFPDDGEQVSDPEWINYGLVRGWSLLTQDLRIATQPAAMEMLRAHRGSIFCLDSAELSVRVRAERFHSRQGAIYQYVRDGRTGFFVIGEAGRPRLKRGR